MASPRPVAVLFADSHLAERTWATQNIFGDSYHAFRQIIDYAVKYDVPVIGAGDLLDRVVNRSDPIVFLYQQLDVLRSHKLRFFYIQGQHELADTPWLSGHTATSHLDDVSITLDDNIRVFGIDYNPPGILQARLAKIPDDCHLLIAHQVWGEFMGTVASPQGNLSEIPHASVVFTGDYHVNKQIDIVGATGQALAVYSPGSTCMQDKSEQVNKYCFLLLSDGKLKRVPLTGRPVMPPMTLAQPSDVDALIDALPTMLRSVEDREVLAHLPQELRCPLFSVTSASHNVDAKRRVLRALDGRAHLFWAELPPERTNTISKTAAVKGEADAAVTMRTLLRPYLEENDLVGLHDDCLRLLDCNDLGAELLRMKQEALTQGEQHARTQR